MSSAQLMLRRLLEQAGGATESGYLLVIDGDGLEELPPQIPTPKGSYGVHRVSTELALRHLLWKAKGAPLIAVMPEAVALRIQKAPDLLRRARNQRVHALTVNDLLEAALGVRVVGADAPHIQKLALENVGKLGLALSRRTLPTVVDRKLLTELLIDVSVGEKIRKSKPEQLLAAWVEEPPQWIEDTRLLVRDALMSQGDGGRLLAWAMHDPEVRLRDLVVYGAVLTVDAPELPKATWGPFWRAATEAPLEMDRRILRRSLAHLAEEALAILGDSAGKLLTQADRVGRETLTQSQLQTSRVLPLAYSGRCHALANQAAGGKAISSAEIAWLAAHRAAPMRRDELAMLEAMARLSRYLDRPYSPKMDPLDQIREYQREGAFADLAALQLRRALGSSAQHHVEANKVLVAYQARRELENRQFAEALAAGYEAALHREGVTPLHRLWKRTVAPVLQADPGVRLFVVVLDGCSYPVFLELLHALSQDNTFPLGIKPDASGLVAGIPALSPLPTITSHARGAIFLGELPSDPLVAETVFRDQEEAKSDKARFNQNAALGTRTRQLFLKGDLADGGQELLSALEDNSIGIVAAVFNAVDDQIGSGNTGATVQLTPENIKAFKPALRMAIKSGRRVLVTADHGHTPYIDNSLRAGNGKTARYLPLGKHDPVPEGFIEIDLAGLGGPPERRAFAWRSGVYLGGPQVGFHGGCGLEEMVVPLAWVERDGLQADEPAWWFGRGALAESSVELRPITPPIITPLPSDKIPSKKAASRAQLSLFDPGETADLLPLAAETVASLNGDERSVLMLLRENGSARSSELAERLQRNPVRLNGLMRVLRRKLFAVGQVLFVDEKLPEGETMYRYLGKDKH